MQFHLKHISEPKLPGKKLTAEINNNIKDIQISFFRHKNEQKNKFQFAISINHSTFLCRPSDFPALFLDQHEKYFSLDFEKKENYKFAACKFTGLVCTKTIIHLKDGGKWTVSN